MTKFLLLIFILFRQFAFGQSIDSVNKIVIQYVKSHNSWGNPGIYGRWEVIEFSKTSNDNFKISRHVSATLSAGDDGKTFHNDTIELSTKTSKIITKEKIKYWLTQLNTNEDNFTLSYIKPQLKMLSKNEIFKVAKKYNELWILDDTDFDREDKAYSKKAINEMKRYYGLDSFLIYKRPTIEDDKVVTDNYNGLIISTINNTDTTEYRCQFYEPLGQPIIRYNNRNYTKSSKVFNLIANVSAQTLLPKSSMISKALDLNNIKEDYIIWYLKMRM